FNGKPSQAVLNRMTTLMHTLSGIAPKTDPGFQHSGIGTRVYDVSSTGKECIVHGDVDAISPDGIQSMTKCMASIVANDWITTTAQLDTTYTVQADDIVNGNRLQVGDVVSFRDLMY